jgi:hypothetical protein
VSRRLKVWSGIVLSCLAVVVIVVATLLHWMNGSATGAVHVGNPQAVQASSAPAPITVNTGYFTTELPGGFTIKQQSETPRAQFLLRLEANTSATQDEQFAATVGTMPSDGLHGIGDYNLRLSKPESYTVATVAGLPAGAAAFRTTSGPAELTVFWPHGSAYAELAFSTSGGASEGQLEALYGGVLAHWIWR